MKIKILFTGLLLLVVLASLSGCFSINYIKFVSPDKGAKINVDAAFVNYNAYAYSAYSSAGVTPSSSYSGIDTLKYPTVNHYAPPSITLRIEKKGYRTKIYTTKKPFSPINELPALTPYPSHKEDQRQMYIERVSINIDSNNMTKNYYNSMEDFDKGKLMVTAPMRDKITYKKTGLNEDLNSMLIDLNYIDTANEKKLSFLDYNWVKVYTNVTGITINDISSAGMCVELTSTWKMVECMTGKTLYNHTYNSRSNWGYENDTLIVDAIKQGLLDFLNDPSTQSALSNGKAVYENIFNTWDSITIPRATAYSTTIQQAAKAVVTVKLSGGHGSGCLISSNGYIITNSHVTSDTNKFCIIFQNGDIHYAKLIRSNPLYDLALIKVDTIPTTAKPLKILTDDSWAIGNDVFAIGTPEDIDLGQTLTRGIISAIRVVQDRKYIQTDVSINPGNSGGALTNTDGGLIGIVKAKLVKRESSGLGFVIPSDYISKALKLSFK